MTEPSLDIAIVGAGFSGIAAGLAIGTSGRRIAILERSDRVGGVWRDTLYPGTACDVPSNLYSLQQRPNPDWQATYASQPEILAYLEGIAARDLGATLRLGVDVYQCRWDADASQWRIAVRQDGAERELSAAALVLAVGPHGRPRLPSMEGIERFRGTWSHSAAWTATPPLEGRRVAVIGSGASAVQIVPALADTVAELHVVQRSAAWVLPRGNRLRAGWVKSLYRAVPPLQALSRAAVYWLLELAGAGNLGNQQITAILSALSRRKLAQEVPDPALRRLLTPDYPIGCKRVTVSDDYWPAFTRETVHLHPYALVGFDTGGPVLSDGRTLLVDHIVFATGYRVADADGFLNVEGLAGHRIPDLWLERGARAYLGTVAAGFPNLAFLLGPNSGLSHSSAIHVVESQLRYIALWLDAIDRLGPIAPAPGVEARYNAELERRFVGTVWAAGCNSWYLDRTGRNAAIFPGLTASFRRRLARFDADDYVRLAPISAPAAP